MNAFVVKIFDPVLLRYKGQEGPGKVPAYLPLQPHYHRVGAR
jgi:hypothetical protein